MIGLSKNLLLIIAAYFSLLLVSGVSQSAERRQCCRLKQTERVDTRGSFNFRHSIGQSHTAHS